MPKSATGYRAWYEGSSSGLIANVVMTLKKFSVVCLRLFRIEHRLADGACNLHLAQAAILAAGLDGIESKLGNEKQNDNSHHGTFL